MVRLGFAAINASADGDEQETDGQTLEAQEARVADSYMRALQLVQDDRKSEAQDAFEVLLVEPLLSESGDGAGLSMASAKQLRHVILKNLAALLAEEDKSAMRALQLYAQALMLDDGDAVVWNRMGTLAAECGLWGAARNVFEHGLARHPRHALMLEKLVEVVLQLGDWHAAAPLIRRILKRDPGHPRAQKVSALVENPCETGRNGREETDSRDILQPRFRQRLQEEQPSQQSKGHRQVALPSATWAALLQAVTDLIRGSSKDLENAPHLGAGESVTLQLPAESHSNAAEEIVGECRAGAEGLEGDVGGAAGEVMYAEQAPLPDQAAVLPPIRRGRCVPNSARKSSQELPGRRPAQHASAQVPPEPDEATGAISGAADETEAAAHDRNWASSAAEADEVARGIANGSKGGAGEEAALTPKKDAHAPSRVSRRLEARREGRAGTDDEGNGGSEMVNIIAMLFPFLPERPPVAAAAPVPSTCQTPGSARAAAAPQPPPAGGNAATERREEERSVRAFLLSRPPKESLHSLGAAAVEHLASDPSRRLPPEALPKLLELATALGSGWQPMPAVALTLAELHLDRAALCGPAAAASPAARAEGAAGAQEGAQPTASVAVSGKGPASRRIRAAQEAAATAHVRACEAFLGDFLMEMLQSPAGDRPSVRQEAAALKHSQLTRHQWALGRLAELRRDFAAAVGHYAACHQLCKGEAENGSAREPLVVSCINCERDAEISAAAATAKVEGLQLFEVLESSKRHLAEGRPVSVIDELAPALLGDDVAAARALRSDRKTFLDALQMLQDAATNVEDAALELRCRLLALTHLLPALAADVANEVAHTAAAAGPPPLAVKDCQKPVKALLTQALTELTEFVAKHKRAEAGGLQALAPALDELQTQELPEVQWRVAVLVERYFWSLCPAPGGQPRQRGAAGRSFNVKEVGRQAALLAAVSALCALGELRSAARRELSRDDISADETLLRTASGILAARRALTQHHGAWVKYCLTRLASLLQALNEAPEEAGAGQQEREELDEEAVTLEARVEGALAQCLHVLYGIDVPNRNPDWGNMEDQVVSRVAMRTPEECLDAWRYIRPYAEGIAHDKKALSRLQGVLQAMQKHFKAPPQPVLEAWRPDALLDAPDLDEAYLLQGPRPTAAQELLAPPPQLQQAVASDEHAGVHAILHHLLLRLQPDLDVLHKDDIALLPVGAAAVEGFVQLACYDLRYNPLRYFAWDRIAAMYREASEGIVKMAAEELSVDEWHSNDNADLRMRFELYQMRAARATLLARQLCPVEDTVFHDEQAAMLLHERLQHAPPLYDQLARMPERALVQRLAGQAAGAYERAVEGLPDEWLYHMFLGKMRAKSSCPPQQYLGDLARACALASVHAGGLVEPLYRLHATRLKLLHRPRSLTPAALALLARYCFDDERELRAKEIMKQCAAGAHSVGNLVEVLIDDCEAAMRWCLEKDKGFHKAHHALARSLQVRGRFQEAAEELRQLFTSHKRPFCISMWEIGDKLTKATGLEVERQSTGDDGASSALSDDEASWGRRPPRTAGNGLEESHRKFAACRRKYLIRYLDLLARTGNCATLAAAHSFLLSPQQWSNPAMMADIARLALGWCIITLAGQLRQQFPAQVTPSFPAPSLPPVITTGSGPIPGQLHGLPGAAAGSPAPFGNGHAPTTFMGVPFGEQSQSGMRAAVSDEALPLLEAAYGLYTENFVLGGPEHGAKQWAAALEAVQPVDPSLAGWTGEATFARSAFMYIDELGRRGSLDELQMRLATVRKRCKVLRTANEKVQGLAARIASAAIAALAAALPDLERRQDVSLPTDQAMAAPPPNQADAAVPGPGSPRAVGWAAPGTTRVAVWQPDAATPIKGPPNAAEERSLPGVFTPPPQAAPAAGHAPSRADAAGQQASLELLRHAHVLYKSGVARLPGTSGSLCRLDELLVRAHKLYRGPQQAGSTAITAADAAAAYEELARATRRSSPSGKGSGPASRADRAAEGPRLPGVAGEAGREAAAQQPIAPPNQHAERNGVCGGTDVAGPTAQGGEEGMAQVTADDSSARLATPLTRKRSRREADLAEAVANSGSPARDTPPPADPSIHQHPQQQNPQPSAGDAQRPAALPPASFGASAGLQVPREVWDGWSQGVLPLRDPPVGGAAWAVRAPPAGASLAGQPSDGVPAALHVCPAPVGANATVSDSALPAAKRLRPDD